MNTAESTARRYYAAFNAKDYAAMLAEVTEDIRHDVNQGEVRRGKALFEAFVHMMDRAYRETLTDMVFFTEPTGTRVAVEFVVNGEYLQGEPDMPPAHGQKYVLPAGAFLEVREGKVSRVTTYYNAQDWLRQVSEA